jgi:hypothetical protein
VEAALVRSAIVNEVVLDPVTRSATDWVVTMPTRRFHRAGLASPWFQAAEYQGELRMSAGYLSRSGSSWFLTPNCGFLCPPYPSERRMHAPWAATVFGFTDGGDFIVGAGTSAEGTTRVLGSTNGWMLGVPLAGAGGNMDMEFVNPFSGSPNVTVNAVTTRLSDGNVLNERIRLYGLPVTGFMLRTLKNDTIACSAGNCQGNYGGSATHRFKRRVAAPGTP